MIMGKYGTVSYAMAYTAVLGFALLGFAQIAVGVFWSSVTENPVIAAVVTFIVLFVCYMITGIGSLIRTVPCVSGVLYASGAAGCCVDIPYDPESVDRSSYRYRRRSGTCHHLCGKIHTI